MEVQDEGTPWDTHAADRASMIGIPDPRTPFDSHGRLMTDALAGIRYVLRHRTLRGLGLGLSLWNIGGVGAVDRGSPKVLRQTKECALLWNIGGVGIVERGCQ